MRALAAACTAGLAAMAAIAATALPASAATTRTAPASAVVARAAHATIGSNDETLIAEGPHWAIYADAKIPGVKPVVITDRTPPRVAAQAVANGVGNNCGIVTCTLYIYRGTTKTIDSYVARYANASTAAIAAAFAAICSVAGPEGTVVCAGIGAVEGGYAIDQFNYAASHNQCIGIKYIPIVPPAPVDIYPDNDQYCHD